ncbi:MAG: hypothetical protein CVU22_15660 [Betaproteobacteria bacterium HGW-Betaproteobacteria-16]|nr:MAG: hypothetical protein CVU22_15660 [Betaproteobacteria bacterium HGW-Betaproteobacteria-16]
MAPQIDGFTVNGLRFTTAGALNRMRAAHWERCMERLAPLRPEGKIVYTFCNRKMIVGQHQPMRARKAMDKHGACHGNTVVTNRTGCTHGRFSAPKGFTFSVYC